MTARHTPAERGAGLVEFVLVLPLLALLAFGAIDAGRWYQAGARSEQAAAAGARTGANLGDDALTDYMVLRSIEARLDAEGMARLDHVVVYRSDATGWRHPGCATGSVLGECNHYTAADFARTPSAFSSPACDGSTVDAYWCPEDRDRRLISGPDQVGVRVVVRVDSATGILPVDELAIGRDAVMTLEPVVD